MMEAQVKTRQAAGVEKREKREVREAMRGVRGERGAEMGYDAVQMWRRGRCGCRMGRPA